MFTVEDHSNERIDHSSAMNQYWKSRLDSGRSYQMSLLDDLVDAFDCQRVFSNNTVYTLDDDELRKMSSIASKWLCKQTMQGIELHCYDLSDMLFFAQKTLLCNGFISKGIDITSCSTMLIAAKQHSIDSLKTCLAFNKDVYSNVNFKEAVIDVMHSIHHSNKLAEYYRSAYDNFIYGKTLDFAALDQFDPNVLDACHSEFNAKFCTYENVHSINHPAVRFSVVDVFGEDISFDVNALSNDSTVVFINNADNSSIMMHLS